MDEVRRLGTLKGADVNDAKVILADEATRLCHGIEAAEKAKEAARATLATMEWVTDYTKFQSQPFSRGAFSNCGAYFGRFYRVNGDAATPDPRRSSSQRQFH